MEYTVDPDESMITAVCRATGACAACDSCDFDPLHSVVDPEALAALFSSRPDGTPRPDCWVSFALDDCLVTVDAERITIEPRTTDSS